MNNSKKRNSNIELYRIVCMLVIITSHFGVHGFELEKIQFSLNRILISSFSLGEVGVIGFVLISGYYMVDTNFNIKKLLKISGQVSFYSILFLVLFCFIIKGESNIGIYEIISSIFPILYNKYWFVTSYVCLMLVSPFLNKIINNIEEKDLKSIIIILFTMWTILCGLFRAKLGYSNFGYFIFIYFIAAYIKKYISIENINLKKNNTIFIISTLIMMLSFILLNYVGHKYNISILYNHTRVLVKINNPIVLFMAITSFIFFLSKKSFTNKIINFISACTFGVYLIHDNSFVRKYLWNNLLNVSSFATSKLLIIYSLLCVISVYIICMIMEIFRIKLLEPLYMKMVNIIIDKYNDSILKKRIDKYLCKKSIL